MLGLEKEGMVSESEKKIIESCLAVAEPDSILAKAPKKSPSIFLA
jgi:hypothetical protein